MKTIEERLIQAEKDILYLKGADPFKTVNFKIKMKPTTNKKGEIVEHEPEIVPARTVHLSMTTCGSFMAAKDIESIEIMPMEEDE